MPALHALDYLADAASTEIPPVCVAFGDEPFLKALALAELRRAALGVGEAEFSATRFEGRLAEPRAVFDELSTVALFGGGGRLVIVDDADEFVTRNRAVLEDYVARPSKAGALVLVVDAWPSNTRLAKAVAAQGLAIECKLPPPARVLKWLESWARSRYQARLERSAAELLREIVGDEMGLLDQELAKLAAAAQDGPISAELVQRLVGGWRAQDRMGHARRSDRRPHAAGARRVRPAAAGRGNADCRVRADQRFATAFLGRSPTRRDGRKLRASGQLASGPGGGGRQDGAVHHEQGRSSTAAAGASTGRRAAPLAARRRPGSERFKFFAAEGAHCLGATAGPAIGGAESGDAKPGRRPALSPPRFG